MALSNTAAVAYINLSDLGTVTASSSIALAPPATLQNPHVARKWRGRNGDTEVLVIDLLSVQPIDTVLLRGLNLSAAGITRLRISAADTSAQTGDLYDSTVQTGLVDPAYQTLLFLLPAPVSGRYLRIDLSQPGAAYLEAGRLFVGLRQQFGINFSWGWNEQWVDRSRESESRGGQTYIDPDVSYRVWSLSFDYLTEDEKNQIIVELDRLNGIRTDFLMIADPASANLGRSSIWGRGKDVAPIFQPIGFTDSGGMFTKSFKIYERL
jgi:hypothetical protein